MEIVTADWETYYDKEYSLSKLTTEAYVRDPRFEVIMLGLRWPDGTKEVVTGTHAEIRYRLDAVDWSKHAILCHNTVFDAAIFAWHFGVKPRVWLDTLSMGRGMFSARGNSLALLAKKYNMEDKGTEVQNAMGKHRKNFTPGEFDRYAAYCLHDVDLCYDLWHLMSEGWYNIEDFDKRDTYPLEELKLIDRHIRMFTEPVLRLNKEKLEAHLAGVIQRKEELLSRTEFDKARLSSNTQFAMVLDELGVIPPMKISKTTGKPTYAFAKTDPELKALLEHPDERVQAAVAARLGTKSTLEETRTQTFIDIATRDSVLPVPLKYAYARTKRSSGGDGINLQNLPARGGTSLKACIEAPPGHVLIDCDSSNIEARVLAWLAGQEDLVLDFANGVDVYCKMASRIYGRTITKADKNERFLGKTVVLGCLAQGTLVLCERGWVPIEHVTTKDRVWDGLTWVNHQGLLQKGLKETLSVYGLWLTPDHKILCGTEWRDAQSVLQDEKTLCQILDTGAANLPSQATWRDQNEGYQNSLSNAIAGDLSTLSRKTTSNISKALDATHALLRNLTKLTGKVIGFTQMRWLTMRTANGFSIAYPQLFQDVTKKLTERTHLTEVEGSLFVNNGGTTSGSFSGTYRLFPDGTTQILKWTAQTITKGMNRGMYVLSPEVKTLKTEERFPPCKPESKNLKRKLQTYDLALAGPRNRFTVLTERGPVIVHNCGYQTGAYKLQATLKVAAIPMDLEIDECERIIDTYRSMYPQIKRLWYEGDVCIQAMHDNKSRWFGREGAALIEGRKGVRLPSGLYISYPQLHRSATTATRRGRALVPGHTAWQYKDDTGLVDIYGGKFTENVVQALARIVVMSQLLKISRKYRVALTVHDSIIAVAKEDQLDEARAYVESCMRWVPEWAPGLPINCESKWGHNYGELSED